MFITKDSIWQSTLISSFPGLVHGYSTRSMGSMLEDANRKAFLAKMGFDEQHFVRPGQVHGKEIFRITNGERGRIADVDGLLYSFGKGQKEPIVLGVFGADCIPLLFVDPVGKMIGTAHAGWKGSLAGISTKVMKLMMDSGSRSQNIYVVIGPHIGQCCYSVPEERAKLFLETYGVDDRIAVKSGEQWFLNLRYVNYLQLVASGVQSEHIEYHPTCTACQNDTFFSYRRKMISPYGEMLGMIGLKG